MPVGVNLLFTVLLWTFFTVILFSNRKDKVNQWCFAGGMIFSLGVLKEYFFFDLIPFLEKNNVVLFSMQQAEAIYSVMTAALYLLAMPAALIFSFYFSDFHFISQKGFMLTKWGIVAAILVFVLAFDPVKYRQYQLGSLFFWAAISVYNLTYGVWLTMNMVRAVLREKNLTWRKQKRRVAGIFLPLLWYWLITIFIIHTLNIRFLFQVWRNNVVLLSILLGYYVIMAFREGIMGLKLEAAHYRWSTDVKAVQQGAQFVNHFLKNEVTKMEWCAKNLAERSGTEVPEEIGILSRSVDRLKYLIQKTQLYSKDIQLSYSVCPIRNLVESCAESVLRQSGKNITFENHCGEKDCILCDPFHLSEVVNNLLSNAADAIAESGTVSINFDTENKREYILSVRDSGAGMGKEPLAHLFEPYYSSKMGDEHFGLGLFYCYRVMQKHNGKIDVKSEPGAGTVFYLHFPKRAESKAGIGVWGRVWLYSCFGGRK